MTWREAQEALLSNLTLLALSDDKDTRLCATTIRDYGIDAGVAVLCSSMFTQKNGIRRTFDQAIALYRDALHVLETQGQDMGWTRRKIEEIDHWVAWLGVDKIGKTEWAIPFPFRKPDKKAGLANVMFWTGLSHLDDESNTIHVIVANVVGGFLKEGLERKRGKKR